MADIISQLILSYGSRQRRPRAVEQSGAIDHLVVTRGVVPLDARVESLDLDAVRRFMEVMLVSALTLTKYAVPKLRRGGSIVFTTRRRGWRAPTR